MIYINSMCTCKVLKVALQEQINKNNFIRVKTKTSYNLIIRGYIQHSMVITVSYTYTTTELSPLKQLIQNNRV